MLAVGGLGAIVGALYLWGVQNIIASGTPGISPWWTYLTFTIVNALPVGLLWWHRRYPLLVFAATLLVFVFSALLVGHAGNGGLTLPLWFSVYALAAYAPLRGGLVAMICGWLLCAATKFALAIHNGLPATIPNAGLASLDLGFFFIASFAVGFAIRLQRQRASDAAERARLIEEHSRALNAEAIATERNRLARDLHDLAAHEVMDVLLSVRALRLTDDDPVLNEVEQKIARALNNMRTVVRTLREDDHQDLDREPLQDSARHLIDTLAGERGIKVEAHIRIPVQVGDAAVSTTLSVLKEALINADTHAPGQPVTVALNADDAGVRLTVTNPTGDNISATGSLLTKPRSLGTGYGLIGAAERAGLLGGRFEAGPAGNGDWLVTLQLPTANEEPAYLMKEAP